MIINKIKTFDISKYDSKIKYLPYLLLSVYFIVNLGFLSAFPFVHSDESWLSGFSRTVLNEHTFRTSEPFFDLYPRAIHGLRVVFVSLQLLFIKVFGYSVFSVRLMSLFFSTLSLGLIYKVIKAISKKTLMGILFMLIMGVNIQFIMSAHTARQEAPILFFMLFAFYVTITSNHKYKDIWVGSIIGIAVGIHPNSFIIACGIGLIYLYKVLSNQLSLKRLVVMVFIVSLWAGSFVALSLYLNPNFIQDYLAFGNQLGISQPSIGRIESFYYFYYKLFNRIGGTYHLVNIRFDLMLLGIIILGFLIRIRQKRVGFLNNIMLTFMMLTGINIAYMIIGRFNQTSILFTIVFIYLLLAFYSFDLIKNDSNRKWIIYGLLLGILAFQIFNTYSEISKHNYDDYEALGQKIKMTIPKEAKILGNLNLDYHFENYQLLDIRNLMVLEENNLKFKDYIRMNNINYIILYEELDYIKNSNGKWDILYGPLDYYEDMLAFIESDCSLEKTLESSTYGMRIARYIDSSYPWYIKIYTVNSHLE